MTKKFALLIIDMINDFNFPNGEKLAAQTKKIVPSILALKTYCRSNDIPVIYVNDHYNLWKADIELLIDHVQNDISAPIIQQMKPERDDYFLIKPKHSGFYGTALNTLLHEFNTDAVIVTGVAGNICVFFTANDAYMREFDVYVPSDGTASESPNFNEYALNMMETVLKADVRPASQLISLLKEQE
ncbi:isochorismatase family cysteine hydrolase [Domibacillus epiphyticus]|uniref:Isochorismatase n=1 Tax=Domibacillus epiphyticus TaxID=1714355 RepID=A0A1V2A703_9BACI|nr:isochorismatase family cysteine hydrolase [Domibacillus epiphyticus]OMP66775.1 isochorismatase [Domibacillus epiphyticus]